MKSIMSNKNGTFNCSCAVRIQPISKFILTANILVACDSKNRLETSFANKKLVEKIDKQISALFPNG